METTKRSVLKAVLWNTLGLVSMTLTGVLLTGSATVGGALAVLNTAIGFVVYLIYERVWARIAWGRHA
ncbi:MAG TPA: DUF2061 domain-containing protein [Albidovulum sp.]|uniref:DUF2061 domain-containing protein n=1 Tax=Albidovulum sp. TaxID=1872424 RepID=UPI002CC36910|nr:DUF2061 domain-containing protein [Albidovulum sp.]